LQASRFSRQVIKCILPFLAFVILQFDAVCTVSGRPFRLRRIPDKGGNFGCATCHVSPNGGGELNGFGLDFKKHGIPNKDRYSKALGRLDSDGDGFTNDEEFAAVTHPGDPNSSPKGSNSRRHLQLPTE